LKVFSIHNTELLNVKEKFGEIARILESLLLFACRLLFSLQTAAQHSFLVLLQVRLKIFGEVSQLSPNTNVMNTTQTLWVIISWLCSHPRDDWGYSHHHLQMEQHPQQLFLELHQKVQSSLLGFLEAESAVHQRG
jgi:hypothetical protein